MSLVARKDNLTGFSTGLTGRSKNLDPTGFHLWYNCQFKCETRSQQLQSKYLTIPALYQMSFTPSSGHIFSYDYSLHDGKELLSSHEEAEWDCFAELKTTAVIFCLLGI